MGWGEYKEGKFLFILNMRNSFSHLSQPYFHIPTFPVLSPFSSFLLIPTILRDSFITYFLSSFSKQALPLGLTLLWNLMKLVSFSGIVSTREEFSVNYEDSNPSAYYKPFTIYWERSSR